MNRPLVSVIIIFLNAEQYLQEAIESVLHQTFRDFELLLVDDGSTDHSTDIARRFEAESQGRVRYLHHRHHENRGKGVSRNLGIAQAHGIYVSFLDADDVYLSNKLEEQVAILASVPEAAMVYGRTVYWYSWQEGASITDSDYIPSLGLEPHRLMKPPTPLASFLRGNAAVPCTCSILVRKSVLKEIGGFEESFLDESNIYEDQTFYAKLCLNAPSIAVDVCWDKYRQHSASSVALVERAEKLYQARLTYLRWLRAYMIENGAADEDTWQALQEQLWLFRPLSLLSFVGMSWSHVRWVKKWFLRFHRILPRRLQSWLWLRGGGIQFG